MNSIDYYKNKKGLSYKDIANEVGCSAAYIHMLAKGIRINPSMKIVIQIAKILDVSVDKLIN